MKTLEEVIDYLEREKEYNLNAYRSYEEVLPICNNPKYIETYKKISKTSYDIYLELEEILSFIKEE